MFTGVDPGPGWDLGFGIWDFSPLRLSAHRPPEAVEPESLRAELRELLDAVAARRGPGTGQIAAEKAELVGAAHGALGAEKLHDRTVEPREVHHVEALVSPGCEPGLVEVDDEA